jgi:hypothetical protein
MSHSLHLQRTSSLETADPAGAHFSVDEWLHAVRETPGVRLSESMTEPELTAEVETSPHHWIPAFYYRGGIVAFAKVDWGSDHPVEQAARRLARHLHARVFGEPDEEYAV